LLVKVEDKLRVESYDVDSIKEIHTDEWCEQWSFLRGLLYRIKREIREWKRTRKVSRQ